MTRPSIDRLDGLLTAIKVIAEVTGPIKIGDMSETAWRLFMEINVRLTALAASWAAELENTDG